MELSTNTSWLSKLSTIERVRTRLSAKPPISSSAAIHKAATPIMRRLSEPIRRRGVFLRAGESSAAAVTGAACSFN